MSFSTSTWTAHSAKSLGGTASTVSPVSPTADASNQPANAVVVGDVVTDVVGDGVGVMVLDDVTEVVGVVEVVEVGVVVGVVRSQSTKSPATYAVIMSFSACTVAGQAAAVDTKCWYCTPVSVPAHCSTRSAAPPASPSLRGSYFASASMIASLLHGSEDVGGRSSQTPCASFALPHTNAFSGALPHAERTAWSSAACVAQPPPVGTATKTLSASFGSTAAQVNLPCIGDVVPVVVAEVVCDEVRVVVGELDNVVVGVLVTVVVRVVVAVLVGVVVVVGLVVLLVVTVVVVSVVLGDVVGVVTWQSSKPPRMYASAMPFIVSATPSHASSVALSPAPKHEMTTAAPAGPRCSASAADKASAVAVQVS